MWGSAKCPVRELERAWIEESLAWLRGQFGDGVLRREVLLPSDEFFPGAYTGSPHDIRRVFGVLRRHFGVEAGAVTLDVTDDDDHELAEHVPHYVRNGPGVAGTYGRDSRLIVVRGELGRTPMALVATLAHELGHARLAGEGRTGPGRRDEEPLTDLAAVFFGCGVFAANAALEFSNDRVRWRSQRLGYLTEPMYGYALACYSELRDEPDPPWAGFLDTNPRAYLRKGLRYLRQR